MTTIKTAARSNDRGVYMSVRGGKDIMVITVPGTKNPMAEIVPDATSLGPVLHLRRVNTTSGEQETVLTVRVGVIKQVIGWLPILLNCAERLARGKT